MRWLIAMLVMVTVGRVDAGTFKARGGDKKQPPAKTAPEKKPAAAKKAPTKAARAKKPVAVKAAPKKPSRVVAKGRPDDLTPDPKKSDASDEDEDDVIIRDLDD